MGIPARGTKAIVPTFGKQSPSVDFPAALGLILERDGRRYGIRVCFEAATDHTRQGRDIHHRFLWYHDAWFCDNHDCYQNTYTIFTWNIVLVPAFNEAVAHDLVHIYTGLRRTERLQYADANRVQICRLFKISAFALDLRDLEFRELHFVIISISIISSADKLATFRIARHRIVPGRIHAVRSASHAKAFADMVALAARNCSPRATRGVGRDIAHSKGAAVLSKVLRRWNCEHRRHAVLNAVMKVASLAILVKILDFQRRQALFRSYAGRVCGRNAIAAGEGVYLGDNGQVWCTTWRWCWRW